MPEFKYKIFQRVMVPGDKETQGIIVEQSASMRYEPEYSVSWLKTVVIDDKHDVSRATSTFPESAIDAAQPPAMVTKAEANEMLGKALAAAEAERADQVTRLRDHIERMEIAAKRRRKAARTRKRR